MALKIDLNSLNLITHWQFNTTSQDCSICRQSLMAPNPKDLIAKNQTKLDIGRDYPVQGACGHTFHKSCIDALIVNTTCLCPIDHSPWKTTKTFNQTISWGLMNDTKQLVEPPDATEKAYGIKTIGKKIFLHDPHPVPVQVAVAFPDAIKHAHPFVQPQQIAFPQPINFIN